MDQSNQSSDFGQPDEKFDYLNLEAFPSRYLKTYFQKVEQDELEVARFLVREYKKIKDKPIFLDLGCGPTVHHVLPVVPYVSRIEIADYLSDNLDEIEVWKNKKENMHDWTFFTKKILELEGKMPSKEAVDEREKKLRGLVNKIGHCDLLNKKPLGYSKKYEAVGCFFCAEEVATTQQGWEWAMENISSLVADGGYLFLSALRNTDHYSIRTHNGEMQKLPTAFVKEEYFYELLPKLGFDMQETVIEVAETPEQKQYGINSVILLSAKKGGKKNAH